MTRGLLATGGWDSFSPVATSEGGESGERGVDRAQWYIRENGNSASLGTMEIGCDAEPSIRAKRWHTLTATIDAIAGVMSTYVDGEPTGEIKVADGAKISKDGEFAIQSRLAIFYESYEDDDERDEVSNELNDIQSFSLRSVTVHSRPLTAEEVKKEHKTLSSLLIRDAIASAPKWLQPVLRAQHAATPLRKTSDMRKHVYSHFAEVELKLAPRLWTALYERDAKQVQRLLAGIKPHQWPTLGHWRRRDPKSHQVVDTIDDATPPFGESLLHMAAYTGHHELLSQLLANGASASRLGVASGCSPLHAAAAADHADLCKKLIAGGAPMSTPSKGKRHTALHVACLKGLEEVAVGLAELGADPYDRGDATSSPMEILRAQDTEQSKALRAALDAAVNVEEAGEKDTPAAPVAVARQMSAASTHSVESGREEEEEYLNPKEQPEAAAERRRKKRIVSAEEDEQRRADRIFEKVAARGGGTSTRRERDEDHEDEQEQDDDEDEEEDEEEEEDDDEEEEDDGTEYEEVDSENEPSGCSDDDDDY